MIYKEKTHHHDLFNPKFVAILDVVIVPPGTRFGVGDRSTQAMGYRDVCA